MLARKPGECLWQRWLRLRDEDPLAEAIVHWQAGEMPIRLTRDALVKGARRVGVELAARGVRRGDVIAMIMRHHPHFHFLYLGIEALGAVPSVLAYPNARLHPEKFTGGLLGMAQRSGLDWVLTERELEGRVRPLVAGAASSVRDVFFPLEWDDSGGGDGDLVPGESDGSDAEPCLLQHSSGTTGLQKGVVLTHKAVLDHIERYTEAIALTPRDKVASWLPLYHDMGLVAGYHLPLAAGITTVLLDPFEWISAPSLLLEAISTERATCAWLPNFAYNFSADRIVDEDLKGIRLDSLRLLVNCSEPVRADSHAKMLARFSRYGLRDEALSASYAMAEATFAVTQTLPGRRAREVIVSRSELTNGFVKIAASGEASRACVSSGVPVRDCELVTADASGGRLPDGRVGEIHLRSASMFDGYKNDPERTSQVFTNGWYKSGDLGFLLEGELYVTGRTKDTIIVAGKNLYPEDIEDVVSAVPGVYPGRVVAIGIEDADLGTERVCVVAETDTFGEGRNELRIAIMRAGMTIDVTIAKVWLAPPRWLVKSSSGKLSRGTNKERVLNGELSDETHGEPP